MLRALGVFSAVPSIAVGLFLVGATLAVFGYALWAVRLEVRLDAMSSRNAAESNASFADGENSMATVDDAVEASDANGGSEPRYTNATNAQATNAQAQGANGGSGRWLSFLQNLCVAEGEQEQLRDTDDGNRNGGTNEAHSPQPIEVEMTRTDSSTNHV